MRMNTAAQTKPFHCGGGSYDAQQELMNSVPSVYSQPDCGSPHIATTKGTMKSDSPKYPDRSPQRPLRKKSSRQVTFKTNVKCRLVVRFNDYEQNEHEARWYTQDEMVRIRKEIKHLTNLAKCGVLLDESESSLRGLERLIEGDEQAKSRIESRVHAREAVFHEQSRQWGRAKNDPEHLSLVYFRFSHENVQAAYQRGAADQREAARIYAEYCQQHFSREGLVYQVEEDLTKK